MLNSIELSTARYERAARLCRVEFWAYRKYINPKLKLGWWQRTIAGELQQFWTDYVDGLRPKLVIQAPPQHGKSTQIVDFITWIIGQNPELKIIYASFSDRLGVRANTKIKKILNSEKYQEIFPAVKIGTPYTQEIVGIGEDGFFRNTTVGGQITGESLDCLVAGTLIHTDNGLIPIEELNSNTLTCKILSFNQENGVLSYERLSNFTCHASIGIYRVTTKSGRILECTEDHRIFTVNNGYTEAGKLSAGEAILCIMSKQCGIEFDNALHFSSCGNSQADEARYRTIKDEIVSVERIGEQAITYDITVGKNHNFFANGILVHNCGIIDDPIKGREAANSETIRNKTWDWFTDDFSTRFADDGALLCILTRWHVDDPIGRLLEQDLSVKVLTYPAIATQDETHRAQGDPLFPEHKSLEFLESLKARMASASWNSLFQQNPTLAEGNFFKPDFIQIVDALPAGLEFVRAWDLAATANGGDYTAGGKLAYDKANQVAYIADYVRGQWGPEDVEKILKSTAQADGVRCKIRLPQDPGQAGKAQIRNLVKLLSGFSVIAETVSGDKETRAAPVAAQVNIGNIYMLRGSWNRAFIEELRLFPNGVNDDQVDAISDGYNHFTIKKIGLF